jgi:hypothetical protein
VRLKYSLTRGIQNLLRQKLYEGAETDSRAKFGKETVAGAHRRPKWVPYYSMQVAQALLRLDHFRRLKWN